MALAAFAVRSGEETRQMQVVCLDDLVPGDDDLRRIEALVDWGQVRRTAEPFYRSGGARRPGIKPRSPRSAWCETLRVAATECTEAGLVGGRRLVVDGTHIEADAALKSLRAELTA